MIPRHSSLLSLLSLYSVSLVTLCISQLTASILLLVALISIGAILSVTSLKMRFRAQGRHTRRRVAVSYTHLTLPTILLV